jgi:hypothetical protein
MPIRSRLFLVAPMIASLLIIGSASSEGDAQTNKGDVSANIPSNVINAFDAKQMKFRTELVGTNGAQQLELTVDFSRVDKLYDIQGITVLVEFFRAGKSIGMENFELATEKMTAVKDRKKIVHDFPLTKKYQGLDITVKGRRISAPAFSDYRYVYQENPTPVPVA